MRFVIGVILAGLLAAGCTEAEKSAVPTAQPKSAATAVATATITAPTPTVVPPSATPEPEPTATPEPPAPEPTTPPTAECDPFYPDLCIPPPPPDLNCKDVPYKRFRVLPPDPHGFDKDGDGVGCES